MNPVRQVRLDNDIQNRALRNSLKGGLTNEGDYGNHQERQTP
jgi:hypothetical protein